MTTTSMLQNLRKSITAFVTELQVDGIFLSMMMEHEVFRPTEIENLQDISNMQERVFRLVTMLFHKAGVQLIGFYKALIRSGHATLADRLLPEKAEERHAAFQRARRQHSQPEASSQEPGNGGIHEVESQESRRDPGQAPIQDPVPICSQALPQTTLHDQLQAQASRTIEATESAVTTLRGHPMEQSQLPDELSDDECVGTTVCESSSAAALSALSTAETRDEAQLAETMSPDTQSIPDLDHDNVVAQSSLDTEPVNSTDIDTEFCRSESPSAAKSWGLAQAAGKLSPEISKLRELVESGNLTAARLLPVRSIVQHRADVEEATAYNNGRGIFGMIKNANAMNTSVPESNMNMFFYRNDYLTGLSMTGPDQAALLDHTRNVVSNCATSYALGCVFVVIASPGWYCGDDTGIVSLGDKVHWRKIANAVNHRHIRGVPKVLLFFLEGIGEDVRTTADQLRTDELEPLEDVFVAVSISAAGYPGGNKFLNAMSNLLCEHGEFFKFQDLFEAATNAVEYIDPDQVPTILENSLKKDLFLFKSEDVC